MQPTLATFLCCVLVAASTAAAQDDLRDSVTLKNGKVLHGRVVERFAADELLLVQGGKRVRVPVAQVGALDTVTDRMRELLLRRSRLPDHPGWRWLLVEWANAHELPAMARLLALDLVLDDDAHEAAHRLLGHRPAAESTGRGAGARGERWLWPLGDRFVTRAELEAHHADFGHALLLQSEHFAVRTDAGLRRTVNALLDLERLYAWWQEELGPSLRLREALVPVQVLLWRDPNGFPAWSSTRFPYFKVAEPGGGTPAAAYSYYAIGEGGAEALLDVATQALLYATLAPTSEMRTSDARFCAWAEVGLAQWVQSSFRGAPGHIAPEAPQLPLAQAQLAARYRPFGLETLTHRTVRLFYGGTNRPAAELELALVHAFTAFLMAPHPPPLVTRAPFLDYVRRAVGEAKGDSSTALDAALGRRVESLEEPWRTWLEQQLLGPR